MTIGIVPRLIHPVKIGWTQIDPVRTPAVDPQFREPTGKPVYLAPVTLTAQVNLNVTDAYKQRPGGDDPQADGHVVIRLRDLAREAPNIALHKGDRITALYVGEPAEYAVNWSIIRLEPRGHYNRSHSLWFCFFKNLKTQSELT